MPRKLTNEEVFDRLTACGLLRDATAGTPGNTTLSAAAAAGALTISVTAETNFTADKLVRIGSGDKLEENVVASTAAGSITLKIPLAYAHAAGEVVRERARVLVGEPSEDGVTVRTTAELANIAIATSIRPYARLLVGADDTMEFAIRNFSIENIAAAAGVPESNISGDGTAATPNAIRLLSTLIATEQNLSFWAQGIRKDATTLEVQSWAVDIDPSQEINLRSGAGTPIRFNGSAKMTAWTFPALP